MLLLNAAQGCAHHLQTLLKFATQERIEEDMGLRAETFEDKATIWDAVQELPSFCAKGSLPTLGRWFSWNQVAHEQMPEFWAVWYVQYGTHTMVQYGKWGKRVQFVAWGLVWRLGFPKYSPRPAGQSLRNFAKLAAP